MSVRVVIVGGGFAGAYCARALERGSASDRIDVTVIDRKNYFLFYPLLVEAGIGTLEPRHVVAPIRSFLSRSAFRMACVEEIDFARQRVRVRDEIAGTTGELAYDHVVLAPGSVTNLPEIPGLREHGFELKSLADAVALRDRAVALLEAAAAEPDEELRRELLHFVVVGANFTGVEVAGEYEEYFRSAVRHFPTLRGDEPRVTIVEREDRILPALDDELAEYALRHLRRRGVDVRLGTTVNAIRRSEAALADGGTLATRTVLWCAGIAPSPLVRRLDLPRDDRGYLRCGRDFRVEGCDDVWAIGDAAVNLDADGFPAPATAQEAVQQGRQLAKNIDRVVRGEETRPYEKRSVGTIAALGCRTGVAKLFGIKLSGFAAWWMFRTVYLWKMPGIARKLRIALDWTLELFFPRDIVQLGVHRPRRDEGPTGDEEKR